MFLRHEPAFSLDLADHNTIVQITSPLIGVVHD